MISSKEELKHYLESDKKSLWIDRKKPRFVGDEIWKFQILLRKVEYYKNIKLNPISKLKYYYTRYKFHKLSVKLGFSIPPNVFGPGLAIAHIGTIVVNDNCRVGKNCRIYQNTGLGANTGGPTDVPKLGDNCYIGPGAKLFGDITIADNISIGANSVVTKSFTQQGITVAGVPAKQISNVNSNESLMMKSAL
ncbi:MULTISPECIES: serine O-acetyltransferase [Bacillus cereus group]|uniref:serine O-acetyltransferase n=1 Tax=Bacillus cereus group TaxID=86661 RepID=UPI000279D7CB|nr:MULTISPECIES: serine acetyltransferase [Bacillus cereus group]EJR68944.1 hypothetical protein IK3_00376 [Bacillus toyonensis]MBJ7930398.1 serine acetyltransferase [Bacillus cereus group sp. N31]MBU4641870.1 serine acetyltransferase [Bacillus toyonensis]PDZ34738.1 serine acetyltransferase [Bacillus toyonensis]PEG15048.1 serine acetyltransferase [Bacillus toyonensis]